jgi:hypothetical protein
MIHQANKRVEALQCTPKLFTSPNQEEQDNGNASPQPHGGIAGC